MQELNFDPKHSTQDEWDMLSNRELFEYRDFFRAELASISQKIADGELEGGKSKKAGKYERLLKSLLGMIGTAIGKRFRRRKRKAPDGKGEPQPLPDTTQITIPEARKQFHEAPVRFRPENKEIAVRYN